MAPRAGLLRDVRVLDFGRFIAAPYCSLILAEMGAEVIRVERPRGEEDRRLGLKAANGESFTFLSLGRNKKSITLDLLRQDAPRDVLHDLVRHCDVFLHNFSPRASKAFRLAYQDIRKIKPGIIYTGVSAYGA